MTTIVVSPYRTLKFLEGGGHFWVYMQYVHALQKAGCEVYWFERFYNGDAGSDRSKRRSPLPSRSRPRLGALATARPIRPRSPPRARPLGRGCRRSGTGSRP